MKKNILLNSIFSILLFTGCRNENDELNNTPEPQMLLSKITTTDYKNPSNITISITALNYNSNKQLVKVSSENRLTTVEYDNNGKPSKTTYYKADGTVGYYTNYTYNGDQLTTAKAIYTNTDSNQTITYTYTNGKVTTITHCQTTNCSNPSTDSYSYNGENISTEILLSNGISAASATKRDFLYDNKINPYSLINKDYRISIGGAQFLSQNNYTSEKISKKDSSGNWIQFENISYEIQYNSSQLPTQIIGKSENGANYVKYNYEYILQ